jgi:hypothetical protein
MLARVMMGTWVVLFAMRVATAEDIPDGIYHWVIEGDGRRVPRHDEGGGEIVLGELVAELSGAVTMTSIANDNSLFRVDVVAGGPRLASRGRYFTWCVAGLVMPVRGYHAETLHARLAGIDNAKRVAKALNSKLKLREHPGHRYVVSWTPSKQSYHPGETILLKTDIRNVGKVPFSFRDGGMDRGPRNNQFSFVAHRRRGSGKAIPDTGDPDNHGGMSRHVTLDPGQSFAKEVKLTDSFKFAEADTYRITGMYRMEIQESSSPWPIWNDFAVGACQVHIEKNHKDDQ